VTFQRFFLVVVLEFSGCFYLFDNFLILWIVCSFAKYGLEEIDVINVFFPMICEGERKERVHFFSH